MTDITDHYSIFAPSKDPEPIVTKTYRERRNFDVKKIVEFKSKLRKIDWKNKFISGSAQDDFTIFFNEVKFLFDQTFPKEKVEIKYSNKNPWISNTIKKDIIQREKLHVISKEFPTESNIQKYKTFKNQNLSDQRAAERSDYKDQFGIFGDDLR